MVTQRKMQMSHNIKNTIKELPLVNVLPDEDIDANLAAGAFKISSYKKNITVHIDGDLCTKLEIILSGKVAIDRIDEAGNLLTIAEFANGDILGGNLLFSTKPYYPMTISTQLPTNILEIKKEVLFQLFCNSPAFLRRYLELVSSNTFVLSSKIKYYANRRIRDSVLSYLNYESKKQNSRKIHLPLTKKALAEKIGVRRSSLSRELAKMRKEGMIEFDKESITLLS